MKKYNMSEIMKKTWANFRKAMGTFSKCLKAAWAEAKGVINMKGSEKQVAWAEDIKANMIRRFQADVDWMVKGGTWCGVVGEDRKIWVPSKPDWSCLNRNHVNANNYMQIVDIEDDVIGFINSVDDARVFINNRNYNAIDFIYANRPAFRAWKLGE